MEKALVYIILLLLFCGCFDPLATSSSSSSSTAAMDETTVVEDATDDTDPPAVIEPIIDSTTDIDRSNEVVSSITISIISDNTLYFYNGDFLQQSNVNPKKCGERCFTDGASKVFYDESGQVESTELLFMEPDFIVDDWIVENIEPAEALSMGALYKDYTRFYYQGVEHGNWFLNQYRTTDLKKTIIGEIIAISGNMFYSIVSDLGVVNHADKLLIYEFDAINKTALINETSVSWSTNYFNQADQWQFFNDTWFSWNGYEFTDHLQGQANSLWSWNDGIKPVDVTGPTLINAGTDENNLYFVECNTGWLISFNPEFDQITTIFQLYQGDGLRLSGIDKSLSLQPVLVDGVLYFNDSGLRKIDIVTGISELVMGENGMAEKW